MTVCLHLPYKHRCCAASAKATGAVITITTQLLKPSRSAVELSSAAGWQLSHYYIFWRQKGSVNTTKDLNSSFQAESLCPPVTQSTRTCLLVTNRKKAFFLSGGLLVPGGFFRLFQKRYKGIYRGIYTLIALVFSITVTASSDERECVRTSRFTGLASSVTLAGSFMAITTGLLLQPHNHPRPPSRKLCNTVIFVPLGHSNVY